jgi:VanZ family protein
MITLPPLRRSRLAHALVALYAAAIAYASLQPFGDWMTPLPDTAFWLFAPSPAKPPQFDVIANFLIYIPLGIFASLLSRRATAMGSMLIALATGAAVSFAMETLQWYMPPRYANVIDFVSNSLGALAGGMLGALYTRSPLRSAVHEVRPRFILPGTMGDVGLALLAMWLVAQLNPAIPPFAVTFDPDPLIGITAQERRVSDLAAMLIEATQCAFQLLGVAVFVALLVRDRRYAGGAALLLVGLALLLKGAAALLLLKPAAFVSWLSPGVLLGVVAGTLLVFPATMLPRPAQIAVCATALLSSLLVPLLAPDLMFASPPLTLFNWRYGHLLNFNGLTRTVLLAWPLVAAAWLFVLAGRPAWGRADAEQTATHEPDPL